MSLPLVVSFYTSGTPYQDEIETLRSSCQKFGIEGHYESVPSKGSWVQNCAQKGPFVAECLRKFRRPILWLDADAEVVRYPGLFETLECDFAAYMPRHLLSGTLFFDYNDIALELTAAWSKRCCQQPNVWDQKLLESALWGMEGRIDYCNLPQGYCKISDKRWTRHSDRREYIVHHQASRRFKTTVNQSD